MDRVKRRCPCGALCRGRALRCPWCRLEQHDRRMEEASRRYRRKHAVRLAAYARIRRATHKDLIREQRRRRYYARRGLPVPA